MYIRSYILLRRYTAPKFSYVLNFGVQVLIRFSYIYIRDLDFKVAVPKKKTSVRIKRSFLNKDRRDITSCVRALQMIEIIPGIRTPGLQFKPICYTEVDLLICAIL